MLVTGIDIIEIERIESVVARWGDRFLHRIYTDQELDFCRGQISRLAARFAAKEAAVKALGTGIRGIGWTEVEVVRQKGEAPSLRLHGKAAQKAKSLGIRELALSLSHSRDYAVASVVGWREVPP